MISQKDIDDHSVHFIAEVGIQMLRPSTEYHIDVTGWPKLDVIDLLCYLNGFKRFNGVMVLKRRRRDRTRDAH